MSVSDLNIPIHLIWSHGDSPRSRGGTIEAKEAHSRGMEIQETYPGEVEASPGAKEAYPGATLVHYVA